MWPGVWAGAAEGVKRDGSERRFTTAMQFSDEHGRSRARSSPNRDMAEREREEFHSDLG
jgi:hypothetical protein